MRYGLIELASLLVLGSTMTTTACSDNSSSGAGAGGTASTAGASSLSGGNASSTGGQQFAGGSATGGVAEGGSGAAAGTNSGSVTTLPDTKALNSLTGAEVTQLCSGAYAYYAGAISAATTCKWRGAYFGTQSSAGSEVQLRANCSSKETTCLQDPGASWASNPGCSDIPSDCAATVATYSSCIKDQAAAFTQTVDGFPNCDAFSAAATQLVWDFLGAPLPASCGFCAGFYPADPRTP